MGNRNHLKIISQGYKKINELIRKNQGKKLDISNMVVENTDISNINFKNIGSELTYHIR